MKNLRKTVAVSIAVILIAASFTSCQSVEKISGKITEPESDSAIVAELKSEEINSDEIYNNDGDKLGSYSYIEFGKEEMQSLSEREFIDYCQSTVSKLDCSYFVICFEDGTGIILNPKSLSVGKYGAIDKDKQYTISDIKEYILISNSAVTLKEPASQKEVVTVVKT